ncbi:hypothetical protein PF010_g33411 [Phytophthora fragariae]|uniref:Secreted protein n=1 Tax=Phytophthora fragariae TaxID=53985 RepID=A0A6G0JCD2_9STRA|nr:hypothetical protein PF010_g33411 [Phytophthora fragariae]
MGITWLRLSSLRVLGSAPASSPWPTPDGFISGEFSDGTTSSGIGCASGSALASASLGRDASTSALGTETLYVE